MYDDATRLALLATDPFKGLDLFIFTVANFKGLEKTGVVLINFFEGSARALGPGAKSWRVLLNLLPDGGKSGVAFNDVRRGVDATLDPIKLERGLVDVAPGMETELKLLYVALTRARARLWIWEGPVPGEKHQYLGAAAAPFAWMQKLVLVNARTGGMHGPSADEGGPFVRSREERDAADAAEGDD